MMQPALSTSSIAKLKGKIMPSHDIVELHTQVCNRLNLEELRTLCFVLGIDFDDLGGEGKTAKARELIIKLSRQRKLDLLVKYLNQLYPAIHSSRDSLNAGMLEPIQRNYLQVLRHKILKEFEDVGFEVKTQIKLFGEIKVAQPDTPFKAALQSLGRGNWVAPSHPQEVWKILQQYRCALVYGEAGTGKTTFLMSLSLKLISELLAGKPRPLPIIVKLRDYIHSKQPFEGFIKAQLVELMGTNDPFVQDLYSYLVQGKCILLLDGLDEMPIFQPTRTQLADLRFSHLTSFASSTGSHVIMTSRKAVTSEGLPWTQVQLLPLTEDQITKFVERNKFDVKHVKEFFNSLAPQLKELIKIPFFLTAVLYLFREIELSKLVNLTRGEILYYLIKSRLEAADARLSKHVQMALAHLSVNVIMRQHSHRSIALSQAHRYLKYLHRAQVEELITVASSAGIITSTNSTTKHLIDFTHPLYQSAFVAEVLSYHLTEGDRPSAKRIIVFASAVWITHHARKAEDLGFAASFSFADIASGEWQDIISLAIDIGKCHDAMIQLLAELLNHPRKDLTFELINSSLIRVAATSGLVSIGTDAAMDVLLNAALHAEALGTKTMVTMALRNVKEGRGVSRLIELTSHPEPSVRSCAVSGLKDFYDQEAVVDTMRRSTQDADAEVRFRAAEALTLVGDATGIDILREKWDEQMKRPETSSDDVQPLLQTLQALLRVQDAESLEVVKSSLTSETTPDNIIVAAWILYHFYYRQDSAPHEFGPIYKHVLEMLVPLLRLEYEGVVEGITPILQKGASLLPAARQAQGWAKYKLYLEEIKISLVEQLIISRNPNALRLFRPVAYAALAALLREHIEDERVHVRGIAAFIAGEAHDEQSIQKLGKILDDPDEKVRQAAWWSLYLIGTPEASAEATNFVANQPEPKATK